MKKRPRSKKRSVYLCVLSAVMLAAGSLALFCCIASLLLLRFESDSVSLPYLFFGVTAALSLAMGALGLLSVRRSSARLSLAGLLTGIAALVLLLLLLCLSAVSAASEGFESVYLLIVLYSPAAVAVILYIKAQQKQYASHSANRRTPS